MNEPIALTPPVPGPAVPKQEQSLSWQCEQLVLWLIADAAGQPDSALAGLGIDAAALSRLRKDCAAEIANYGMLQRAARLFTREATGELLRARLGGMALAARTPAELAALTRACRSLPDWAWSEACVDGDGAGVQPAEARFARSSDGAVFASWEGGAPSAALLDSVFGPPLNRAQRRRLQAMEKKGSRSRE
jgi:hypothetical protein